MHFTTTAWPWFGRDRRRDRAMGNKMDIAVWCTVLGAKPMTVFGTPCSALAAGGCARCEEEDLPVGRGGEGQQDRQRVNNVLVDG